MPEVVTVPTREPIAGPPGSQPVLQNIRGARQSLSDAELVEAAQQLDPLAFEALMRRYNRRLFRVARGILGDEGDAEDAVQETYIRAFTHLPRYLPTGSFGAWLTRIAINEALMLKRRLRRPVLSLDELTQTDGDEDVAYRHGLADEAIATCDDPEDASGRAGIRQLLEQALDRLPTEFRIVFVLREVEQLSTAETAACMESNEATVKTRLHRARRRLRADLMRRFRREQLDLFQFGGARCDRIVAAVLARLSEVS